jgi:diguanylate cyclase (GGDEF)-like protein/PAS domain S-box-containing protein
MGSPSSARLRVLRSTGLLDSPVEEAFDRLTRLAAGLLGAPVAIVSLVDEHRQFFKSALGLKEPWASQRETPLTHSFCQYPARDRAPLIVEDARKHPVLKDNHAIRDLGVIAYAGMPMLVSGEAVGAFCVIDDRPRPWTKEDAQLLSDLTQCAVSEIELRVALREARDRRALLDAVIESVADAVVVADPTGQLLVANEAARAAFTAVAKGELVNSDSGLRNVALRDDGSPLAPEEGPMWRAIRGQATDRLTFSVRHRTLGVRRWFEGSGRPVQVDGNVVAGVGVFHDVTERRHRAEVHRAIVEHLPEGAALLIDRDLRYVAVEGPAMGHLLRQVRPEEIVGKTIAEVATDENRAAYLALAAGVLRGERQRLEIVRNGRVFDLTAVPILQGEVVTHGLVVVYDVTDRRNEAEKLRQTGVLLEREKTLLRTTFDHIEDGVVLLDGDRRLLFCNRAYVAMFGIEGDVAGLSRDDFIERIAPLAADPGALRRQLQAERQEMTFELVLAHPRRRVLRRTWTPVDLPSGTSFLVTWHDATAETDLLVERERQLHVDGLTGIPNRRGAESALAREDGRRRRAGTPLSVAVLDVDHFKRINDVHGHATGDEILRHVAKALAGDARDTDVVARWGGEEFIAILPVAREGAIAFCERARRSVEGLACAPVERTTVSAGVAQVGDDETPQAAIARADAHLYEAKRAGRNRVVG